MEAWQSGVQSGSHQVLEGQLAVICKDLRGQGGLNELSSLAGVQLLCLLLPLCCTHPHHTCIHNWSRSQFFDAIVALPNNADLCLLVALGYTLTVVFLSDHVGHASRAPPTAPASTLVSAGCTWLHIDCCIP